MSKVKLEVFGLSYSQSQDNAYVLILVEENGEKRMPIIIGTSEAQAIAIELEKMKAPRPLTHDLFKTLSDSFEIIVDEVLIYRLEEGIFYSRISFTQNGKTVEIDSRTSDAVALAVRFNSPIYTTNEVLLKAGIALDLQKAKEKMQKEESSPFDNMNQDEAEFEFASDEELHQMLDDAIETEDYEKASKIRDELKSRENDI